MKINSNYNYGKEDKSKNKVKNEIGKQYFS